MRNCIYSGNPRVSIGDKGEPFAPKIMDLICEKSDETMGNPRRLYKASPIKHGNPPYYAYFEHPDGSWYMVWMTETYPKTERGHRFHVHASYDKLGAVRPNLESKWYKMPYGMRNWDFDSLEEAASHLYSQRFLPRIRHGYKLIMGNVPSEWLTDRRDQNRP